MKRAFKEAWKAELRNPENKQGTDLLCSLDGSRCCLGVAADLANVPKQLSEVGFAYDFEVVRYRERVEIPPPGWMGLSADDIYVLTHMNDGRKTFPQIADWIEQNIVPED